MTVNSLSSDQKLSKFFPIPSQSLVSDRAFLLKMIGVMKSLTNGLHYMELGSYLGGTLAPFLLEDSCETVLSIDERERQQPDERGVRYDYAGVTAKTMIDNLKKHDLPISKLRIHDGSIDTLPNQPAKFDLAFIDAEHTDEAVFRDYIYVMDHVKDDCIVMFHDSSLVAKGIVNVLTLARKNRSDGNMRFFKMSDSKMSCILFGKYAAIDCATSFGVEENFEAFLAKSSQYLLRQRIANQVTFKITYEIQDPKILKII